MLYQGRPIDHCTHVPGPVTQLSAENGYNSACTTGMALAHFRMLNDEFLNKYLSRDMYRHPCRVWFGVLVAPPALTVFSFPLHGIKSKRLSQGALQRVQGVTQGDTLYTNIFNVIVNAVLCHLVS